MSTSKPTVCVLLPHGYDVRRWRERHARGEVLDSSPYGYGLAADRFTLIWSRDRRESRVSSLIRRGLFRIAGTDVVHVWRNRHQIRAAEVVWTHTEEEYLAVMLLRRLLGRPKVLAQTIWLWDGWARLGRLRKAVLQHLIAQVDLEVVLNSANRDAVHARSAVAPSLACRSAPRSVCSPRGVRGGRSSRPGTTGTGIGPS